MEQHDFNQLVRYISEGNFKKCEKFLSEKYLHHSGTVKVLARISRYKEDKRVGALVPDQERAEYGAIISELLKVAQELKNNKVPSENLVLLDERTGSEYGTTIIDGLCWTTEDLLLDTDFKGERRYIADRNTAISLCPPGWHIPTNDEWIQIFLAYGGYRYRPISGMFLLDDTMVVIGKTIVGDNPYRAYKALLKDGVSGLNLDDRGEYWSITQGKVSLRLRIREYYVETFTDTGNDNFLLTYDDSNRLKCRVRLVKDY